MRTYFDQSPSILSSCDNSVSSLGQSPYSSPADLSMKNNRAGRPVVVSASSPTAIRHSASENVPDDKRGAPVPEARWISPPKHLSIWVSNVLRGARPVLGTLEALSADYGSVQPFSLVRESVSAPPKRTPGRGERCPGSKAAALFPAILFPAINHP
jgi:hypothetical protein